MPLPIDKTYQVNFYMSPFQPVQILRLIFLMSSHTECQNI